MKKIVLICLSIFLVITGSFVLSGCGSDSGTTSDNPSGSGVTEAVAYKDISADELKSLIETNKNLIVVDVREKYEYDEGHLNNSVLIPTSEFANRVNELPKEKAIAVVCASGARSAQVSGELVKLGYKEVYNLSGGLSSWPGELVK